VQAFGGVDVSSSRSSGFRVLDSTGQITPYASAGYRSFESGGGINLSIDTRRLFDLNANQRLWFGLAGNFQYDSTTYTASGLAPGQANTNAASSRSNISTVTGYANYISNNFYLLGRASFDFNRTEITNNLFIPGAQGRTNGHGYALNATIGEIFPLFSPQGVSPAIIIKAPPTAFASYSLFLDASAHYAYVREHQDGFTDNTGFVYGTQQLSYSDVGARARVIAVVPDRGFAWMPFIGATVDRQLGFSNTFDIPAQAVTPADTLIFAPSNTFWGAELGLNILTRGSAKFGMKGFYQASTDTQTVGGSAYLRVPFWDPATPYDSGIRIVPKRRGSARVIKGPLLYASAVHSWAGLYIGAHAGGALGTTRFADPFGTPIYGDQVRTPAFLGGGQIGYNWQAPGSRWVFGVEADASGMDSDGSNTCFAISAITTASTCRVRPRAVGTLTGRVGYTLDPGGRTLIYGKGGLAWVENRVDMALNAGTYPLFPPFVAFFPFPTSSSQTVRLWGGTVGVGVERALTPSWSLKAEYDYVSVSSSNIANLGNADISTGGFFVGKAPPSTAGVSQSFQEVKLGLNYKWGADPWAPGWNFAALPYPVKAVRPLPNAGWEVEGGVRYFGSWGQFKKTFGQLQSLGLPAIEDGARLTYDDMQTHSGEFFGRIETPWNLFVKGYVGGGGTSNGHMNDEDFILPFAPIVFEGTYSNTLSPAVTGKIKYGAIDAGFDFLRGPGYKVGVFAGYFIFTKEWRLLAARQSPFSTARRTRFRPRALRSSPKTTSGTLFGSGWLLKPC
jgi:opacity protein-like surface antigen